MTWGLHRILIIDDDAEFVGMLKEYSERRAAEDGYTVASAENGREGLGAISRERPDLVILDIDMPGTNGIDVLTHIRRTDAAIPVIMLTGNADTSVAAQTLKRGAFSYAPKPLDSKYLDHLIAIVLSPLRAAAPRTKGE